MLLTQGMPLPGRRQHDSIEVWVTIEFNAEHVPDFALIPVSAGPQLHDTGNIEITVLQGYFHSEIAIPGEGHKVVDDGKFACRLACPVASKPLVDGGNVE